MWFLVFFFLKQSLMPLIDSCLFVNFFLLLQLDFGQVSISTICCWTNILIDTVTNSSCFQIIWIILRFFRSKKVLFSIILTSKKVRIMRMIIFSRAWRFSVICHNLFMYLFLIFNQQSSLQLFILQPIKEINIHILLFFSFCSDFSLAS
jgi:hypothetical protein